MPLRPHFTGISSKTTGVQAGGMWGALVRWLDQIAEVCVGRGHRGCSFASWFTVGFVAVMSAPWVQEEVR